MTKRHFRLMQNALALVTFAVVFFSFYFQYALGFSPCPLCLMQRVCACALLFFCLIGLSLGSLGRAKHVSLIQVIFAMMGLFFASRQLWLQSMATPETAACLPGIEMLIRYFPWRELVHLFLWGSNSCGEVAWQGLGLSMAAWSAFYFGLMALCSGILFFRLIFTSIET
jgi:disulfide bond formation protein DsbB